MKKNTLVGHPIVYKRRFFVVYGRVVIYRVVIYT